MDLPNYSFTSCWGSEAFAVENKIVHFGSDKKETTFVLEREAESEQLEVVREDTRFVLKKLCWNTACCVLKKDIYAFKGDNQEEVHQYSLESRKWSLFAKFK